MKAIDLGGHEVRGKRKGGREREERREREKGEKEIDQAREIKR